MDNATTDIANAPLPTPQTLSWRRNIGYQLWRFVMLNIRFVKMITRGEH